MSTVKRIWRLRWAMPPASRATPCSLPVRLMSLTPIFAVRTGATGDISLAEGTQANDHIV